MYIYIFSLLCFFFHSYDILPIEKRLALHNVTKIIGIYKKKLTSISVYVREFLSCFFV